MDDDRDPGRPADPVTETPSSTAGSAPGEAVATDPDGSSRDGLPDEAELDDEAALHDEAGETDPEEMERRSRRHRRRVLREWVVVIAAALLVAVVIRTFLLQQFSIPSESMAGTLERGDRVFVNKLSYRLHDVNRGDVVVFERPPGQPDDGIKDLIKRVIGLPGETLEFRDCQVIVDGLVLEEPYIDRACTTPPSDAVDPDQDGAVTVPEEMVFVMGDNREGSFDSRYFGPIAEDTIVGRAFVIVWPIGRWTWL